MVQLHAGSVPFSAVPFRVCFLVLVHYVFFSGSDKFRFFFRKIFSKIFWYLLVQLHYVMYYWFGCITLCISGSVALRYVLVVRVHYVMFYWFGCIALCFIGSVALRYVLLSL